jgi:hypothetical protein
VGVVVIVALQLVVVVVVVIMTKSIRLTTGFAAQYGS